MARTELDKLKRFDLAAGPVSERGKYIPPETVADQIVEKYGLTLPIDVNQVASLAGYEFIEDFYDQGEIDTFGTLFMTNLTGLSFSKRAAAWVIEGDNNEPVGIGINRTKLAPANSYLETRRHSIVHEVGHALAPLLGLRNASGWAVGEETEVFCDAFTAAILAPTRLIKAEAAQKADLPPLELFRYLYLRCQIPPFMLAKRVFDVGLLPGSLVVNLFGEEGRKQPSGYGGFGWECFSPKSDNTEYYQTGSRREGLASAIYRRFFAPLEEKWLKSGERIISLCRNGVLIEYKDDPQYPSGMGPLLKTYYSLIMEGTLIGGKDGPLYSVVSLRKGNEISKRSGQHREGRKARIIEQDANQKIVIPLP
jgi:hypothetical protein